MVEIKKSIEFFSNIIKTHLGNSKPVWDELVEIINMNSDLDNCDSKISFTLTHRTIEKLSKKENVDKIDRILLFFPYFLAKILMHDELRTNDEFCNYMLDLNEDLKIVKKRIESCTELSNHECDINDEDFLKKIDKFLEKCTKKNKKLK